MGLERIYFGLGLLLQFEPNLVKNLSRQYEYSVAKTVTFEAPKCTDIV